MPCLFVMFAAAFPRFGTLFIWLARPKMFSAAFNGSWLWPVLGIIFLPFTTLMYVFLWTPGIGLFGWDWFWLFMGLLIDISHWSTTVYNSRNYRNPVPGYSQRPAGV